MKYFSAEEMKGMKKPEISEHYKGYEGRNLRNLFAAKFTKNAIEKFGSVSPESAKLLDYGAASGLFFRQLHDLGFKNLYGVDLDNYLDEESKSLVKELKTADCSLDELPWPDNSFDAITAWCFLPHLENPHHCIRETLRILKPGGLFILSIPHILSRASIKYFLKHKDFARYHPEKNHVSAFTPGIFKLSVLKYFQPVAMEYLIDPRTLEGWKGKIRGIILRLARENSWLKKYFEQRWGYNQIWVLKK